MQRLIIRLGATNVDPIHWLVFSEQENEIIASGVLNDHSELHTLQERATSAEVIALAPSSNIYYTEVELPKSASRKALAAIPFMIEEELCGDVDSLFFALGQKRENKQEVCVINKKIMMSWQQAFENANLNCSRLVPDAYCLPDTQEVSLLELQDDLLVKTPEGRFIQGESTWLLPLIIEQAKQNEQNICAYSEIKSAPEDIEINYLFDYLPMHLLMQGALNTQLNLFQGEFVIKRKTNPTWDKWKLAASLAVVALCINLVMKTTELNSLKTERLKLRQQIDASVKQGFPELTRVNNHRIVLAKEIAKLEQGGSSVSMLAMLSRLGDTFMSTGVKPQTIKYDARRSEIRIQSVARSFEALESFTRGARGLGFEVDQGAINNKGDEVVGLIMIRG